MLEGFDFNTEEILHKLKELKDGQNELLAAAYRLYWKGLNSERGEILRAPCMFTILPEQVKDWQLIAKATESHVRVTCWCEHPDGPRPAVPIGSDEPPDYVLKITKEWFAKTAPYISWAATLLKAFVPFVGTEIQQGLEGVLSMQLKDQIDFMTEASKTVPTGKLETEPKDELVGMHRERPNIVTLRHIHDALLKQVPEGKSCADLRPVPTKSGDVLCFAPNMQPFNSRRCRRYNLRNCRANDGSRVLKKIKKSFSASSRWKTLKRNGLMTAPESILRRLQEPPEQAGRHGHHADGHPRIFADVAVRRIGDVPRGVTHAFLNVLEFLSDLLFGRFNIIFNICIHVQNYATFFGSSTIAR